MPSFVAQLIALFPPGVLWNFEEGSTLRALATAIADELARVRARALVLVEESDPRTADETIADWERAVGLPDERVPTISAVLGERRAAVVSKLVARGGQSLSYFTDLVAACGWALDSVAWIDVLRAGFRVNDRVYGDAYAYSIEFRISSPAGPKLAAADLERVIGHALHSHVVPRFTYL